LKSAEKPSTFSPAQVLQLQKCKREAEQNWKRLPDDRLIEEWLKWKIHELELAEGFLRGNIKQGDTLEVHTAGEQLAFKVTHPEQSKPANGSPLRSRG
jgi:hypothetical protein